LFPPQNLEGLNNGFTPLKQAVIAQKKEMAEPLKKRGAKE
jgi:hypothetical protein